MTAKEAREIAQKSECEIFEKEIIRVRSVILIAAQRGRTSIVIDYSLTGLTIDALRNDGYFVNTYKELDTIKTKISW